MHVGHGSWILIDSCIDGQTKRPAALSYLQDIGVNPAQDVKMIVASHWHDDHIRGLASVVEACPQARFVLSDAIYPWATCIAKKL